jgi:hypothetical protein
MEQIIVIVDKLVLVKDQITIILLRAVLTKNNVIIADIRYHLMNVLHSDAKIAEPILYVYCVFLLDVYMKKFEYRSVITAMKNTLKKVVLLSN